MTYPGASYAELNAENIELARKAFTYALGHAPSADELHSDTSPYNTYLTAGLTPTPICSPSLASIKAALAPSDTKYLYFWITDTSHVFSETYDEHLQAISDAKQSQ